MRQLGMFFCLFVFKCCPHILFSWSFPYFPVYFTSPLHLFVVVLLSFLLSCRCITVIISFQTINHSTSSYCRCSAGYLGYTSGFSLSCMVFFLISVSLNWCTSKQIYNTADPLINIYLWATDAFCLHRLSTRNSTSRVRWIMTMITWLLLMATLRLMVRTTSVRPNCLPSTLRLGGKHFSHSLICHPCVYFLVCCHTFSGGGVRKDTNIEFCSPLCSSGLLADLCYVWPSDRVHHPDSGLRVCLPPRGAAHLHWTARVSPESNCRPFYSTGEKLQ